MRMSAYMVRLIGNVLVIGMCAGILQLLNIGCLFRYVGIGSCPSCGLTRAITAMFSFKFHEAIKYHPLFYLVIVIPILLSFNKGEVCKLNWALINLLEIMIGAAFFIRWLFVHFN